MFDQSFRGPISTMCLCDYNWFVQVFNIFWICTRWFYIFEITIEYTGTCISYRTSMGFVLCPWVLHVLTRSGLHKKIQILNRKLVSFQTDALSERVINPTCDNQSRSELSKQIPRNVFVHILPFITVLKLRKQNSLQIF